MFQPTDHRAHEEERGAGAHGYTFYYPALKVEIEREKNNSNGTPAHLLRVEAPKYFLGAPSPTDPLEASTHLFSFFSLRMRSPPFSCAARFRSSSSRRRLLCRLQAPERGASLPDLASPRLDPREGAAANPSTTRNRADGVLPPCRNHRADRESTPRPSSPPAIIPSPTTLPSRRLSSLPTSRPSTSPTPTSHSCRDSVAMVLGLARQQVTDARRGMLAALV